MIETLSHQFLWFDLEMTGLDPSKGSILEFAAVLADDAPGGDFSVVEAYSSVVALPEERHGELDAYVTRMHTANGLLAECAESDVTIEDVDDFLVTLLAEKGVGPRSKIMLAGFSVHFDLGWCRVHLPKLSRLLSHRVFDVSVLRAAERIYGGTDLEQGAAHRALDDVEASLGSAREIIARRWPVEGEP